MTMSPYIFLSSNYLRNAQDENGADIDVVNIDNLPVPSTQTIFFANKYGNIVNRTVDTLVLQNTNIKNMTIESANSLGVYTTLFTVTNNTQDNVFIKLENPVTTSSLRITIQDNTFNPDYVSAKIGVYGFICNLFALTDSNYNISANEGGFRVVSGAYIHYADYKKWVAKISIENLEKAQFDLLSEQSDIGEMTVVPYQDLYADGVYECAVKREYSYELDRKTKLFKLDLELNEL